MKPLSPATEPKEVPSAFSLIKTSIDVVKQNPEVFLFLMVLPVLLIAWWSGTLPTNSFQQTSGTQEAIILELFKYRPATVGLGIGSVLMLLTQGGIILATFKGMNHKHLSISDALQTGVHFFIPLLLLNLLTAVILALSFFLFIVPFFIVLPRLVLAPAYMVDKNLGIIESLKTSWNDTKDNTRPIWTMIGVCILLSIVIGLFTRIPVIGIAATVINSMFSTIAPNIRYKQMQAVRD